MIKRKRVLRCTHLRPLGHECGAIFSGIGMHARFKKHKELHATGQPLDTPIAFKCDHPGCDAAPFLTQRGLRHHTTRQHSQIPTTNTPMPHKCLYCGRGFRTQRGLLIHLAQTENRQRQRDGLPPVYVTKAVTDSEKRRYQCPMCLRGFKHTGTYAHHVIKHHHVPQPPYDEELKKLIDEDLRFKHTSYTQFVSLCAPNDNPVRNTPKPPVWSLEHKMRNHQSNTVPID